jgi:hypothetical protein
MISTYLGFSSTGDRMRADAPFGAKAFTSKHEGMEAERSKND